MESLTRQLYRLIDGKPVTADDLIKTRGFMLDWMGCYTAGGNTEQGKILDHWNSKWGGTGLGQEVFLMAAQSHITETDDLHRGSVTHPACVVFPVAWNLSRFLKKDFEACLLASLKGYEAICRVGEAVGPSHYKIFHNTATAGVFGSATTAVFLLGLNEEQFVWAMGNAGTQAAGLWQFNEDATMSKHLHAGHAAAAGLKAALLAAEGFTGPEKILEGEKGFFKGFCPDPVPDAVTAESENWKLTETSIKPYPSCRHTHPAIDAALQIRSEMEHSGVETARIESVEVSTYETAIHVTDNPRPESTYAAKFSMQYCVSLALRHGFPGLNHFEGDLLIENRNSDLIKNVTLSTGREFGEAYPKHWGAYLKVKAGGETYESKIKSAKGDPENPLLEEELLKKYFGLMDYAGKDKNDAKKISNWILEAESNELIPE